MLTDRFSDALTYAANLHRGQTRKGTEIPYVSHLTIVSALVLEHGGSEDAAIAALLHDAVEDQGGLDTARDIAVLFGSHVAQLVMACTDAAPEGGGPKPPWLQRKMAFVARLAVALAEPSPLTPAKLAAKIAVRFQSYFDVKTFAQAQGIPFARKVEFQP